MQGPNGTRTEVGCGPDVGRVTITAMLAAGEQVSLTKLVAHACSAAWDTAAVAMLVPYDEVLGIHPQDDAFCAHDEWDFEGTPASDYPLMLHRHYVELYRRQVVKQADLVLAIALCGNTFTTEQKRRNVDYYEARTVRDSSLSAATQAVLAAEVGYPAVAHAYLGEACLVDLHDLQHNTRDGLHLAALAGAWTALVVGFGGMRDDERPLAFAPRLPPGTTRLAFAVGLGGQRIRVEVTAEGTRYTVESGPSVVITHHGEPVTLDAGVATIRSPAPELVRAPPRVRGRGARPPRTRRVTCAP